MSDALLQEDAAARRRALEPVSFIVDAPAGAGKTELLTQRTLRLLALVDHPEEVVALTFTNKAATEMRDRILGSLELAARGERPGDDAPHKQLTFDLGRAALARDAERQWQLLQHPGRLAVTTIDSLCGSLARQMPLLSRFGAQPGIADDARPHYRTAARQTLAMVEAEGPEADTVAAALAFMDNDAGRLEKLLVALLGRRDQWLHHTARSGEASLRDEAEGGLQALIRRDLAAAAAAVGGIAQSQMMAAARFAGATLAADSPDAPIARLETWDRVLGDDLTDLPLWRSLADLLLTGSGTLRKRLDKNCGLPPDAKEHKAALQGVIDSLDAAAEAALAPLRDLPPPTYRDDEWATVEIFSRLLNLATAQLWLAFQEAGEVDFGEIAQRAIAALGSDEAPTDLALALDYRIRHLLVDEFQDTSPTQVRLVAGLTRGWQQGDGRSLFLVGDPMQSIYRFRKADVGLFLKVREEGIGNVRPEKLRLYRNNRSRPAVVDWVNATFPAVFPAADEPLHGAVRYAPCLATRDPAADAGVTALPILAGPDDDADRLEAEAILDLIQATRRQRPEADIAVLVRARSHLDGLIAAIRRQAPELCFQAVETESLAGRQPIQDILSLAHALLHRGDRVHWLAVLRAPWCGLTLADLHALAGDDAASTVWQLLQDDKRLGRLSADGQARLRHVVAALGAALAHQGRGHPRRWLEGTWLTLGGDRCLTAATDRQDVAALFRLMDDLVARRRFTADVLQAEAESLFAPPDPAPEALRLQMMTIHKSKGLEFDTVILPGLHRGSGNDEPPLLVWDEIPVGGSEEALVVAPLRARGSERGQPSAYDALRRLEAERSRHESERLLYVAVTRARHRLHLVGVADLRDGAPKAPAGGTLLRLLWDAGLAAEYARAAGAATAPATVPAPGRDPAAFAPDLLRLASADLPKAAALAAADDSLHPPPADAAGARQRGVDAAVGTLAHRCLELIARDGLAAWPAGRITSLEGAYAAWLRNQGLDGESAKAGASRVRQAVTAVLASDIGRWVLAPHPGGTAELALSTAAEGGTAQHVVDRSFIADGTRWIIDYKTVRCDEADPAAFLAARAEEYRPQLERYATLFPGEALPQRLAVFFIEQGRLIELAPRG